MADDRLDIDGEMVVVPRKDLVELWKKYTEYKQLLRSMASEI